MDIYKEKIDDVDDRIEKKQILGLKNQIFNPKKNKLLPFSNSILKLYQDIIETYTKSPFELAKNIFDLESLLQTHNVPYSSIFRSFGMPLYLIGLGFSTDPRISIEIKQSAIHIIKMYARISPFYISAFEEFGIIKQIFENFASLCLSEDLSLLEVFSEFPSSCLKMLEFNCFQIFFNYFSNNPQLIERSLFSKVLLCVCNITSLPFTPEQFQDFCQFFEFVLNSGNEDKSKWLLYINSHVISCPEYAHQFIESCELIPFLNYLITKNSDEFDDDQLLIAPALKLFHQIQRFSPCFFEEFDYSFALSYCFSEYYCDSEPACAISYDLSCFQGGCQFLLDYEYIIRFIQNYSLYISHGKKYILLVILNIIQAIFTDPQYFSSDLISFLIENGIIPILIDGFNLDDINISIKIAKSIVEIAHLHNSIITFF